METKSTKQSSAPSTSSTSPIFKKILVAVDGSESASRAANVALELADKLKAELIILHAISPPSSAYKSAIPSIGPMVPPPLSQQEIDAYYGYAKRVAMGIMGGTISEAKKRGITVKPETPEGVASIVETIINHANRENVGLIIVGTRGLGGFRKLLIGSVSSGVVTHASCPVLIVR
jgi:nucleotide-binding universal stress UspA family protein